LKETGRKLGRNFGRDLESELGRDLETDGFEPETEGTAEAS